MVSDMRSLFECGSVQIKCASVSRTRASADLSFLRQRERSSGDSGRAMVHWAGGERKRSQLRQNETDAGREDGDDDVSDCDDDDQGSLPRTDLAWGCPL